MNVSDEGIALIKEFEGVRLSAYLDSVGVPTIGVGHTSDVQMGDTCTEEEAEAFLRADLADAEKCVSGAVEVELAQNEFDALCSLVFNIGCGNFRRSTLLRLLNEGNRESAAHEFRRWDKAGGQVLAGLSRRRMAEARLFESAFG